MIKNNEKTIVSICIILTIAFWVLSVYSYINFKYIWDIAGLLIMVWLLVSITSFICIFMFSKRSKLVDSALKDNNYIVKWIYDDEQRKDYKDKHYRIQKQSKTLMFYWISILIWLIFWSFVLFIDEWTFVILGVWLFLILFLALFAFVLPRIFYKISRNSQGYAIIMKKWVLVWWVLHSWDFPMSKLSRVEFNNKESLLEIVYEFRTQLWPQAYKVLVLVPENNKSEVDDIIKTLENWT